MLQKVNFRTITNEDCQTEYEDEEKVIFPSQICAGAPGKVSSEKLKNIEFIFA